MHKVIKKTAFCFLLIVLLFVSYVAYQVSYKKRSECYAQYGMIENISILQKQFQYDIYRAILGVFYDFNAINSAVILMNEEELDKNPLFSCRLKEEVSAARKVIQEQVMLEGGAKE